MKAKASPVQQLRELMARKGLTQADVARLAGVSIKTVESWMADPASANHRTMPARHLMVVRAMLPSLAKQRRGKP